MKDLIERLAKATGPDRELDAAIAYRCTKAASAVMGFPSYTSSIDAALTLVPEGWHWEVSDSPKEFPARAGVSPVAPVDEWVCSDTGGQDASAATPAIALCIAALKARSAA